MTEDRDKQFIINYLKGDEKSLEVLIQRYLKPIYSFAFRFVADSQEAEDITQQVFIRAWKSLKRFDRDRSFKTWIFSIAKNACIDSLKKKKSIPFSKFENIDGENILLDRIVDPLPLPQEVIEQRDVEQALAFAMKELSFQYRTILYLRYNDHFTFREIAEILDVPLNTVKSQHRRALIQIKKLLPTFN